MLLMPTIADAIAARYASGLRLCRFLLPLRYAILMPRRHRCHASQKNMASTPATRRQQRDGERARDMLIRAEGKMILRAIRHGYI